MANFILIHFPPDKGKTSADADAFLTKRGLVLRALKQLRPAARIAHDHRHRGSQSPGGRGLARLRGRLSERRRRHSRKLALIGFGLIGGSIARAARAQGLAGEIVATAHSAKTRARVAGAWRGRSRGGDQCGRRSEECRPCHPLHSGRRLRPRGAGDRAGDLKPGAIISDVGSVKGAIVRDMAPYLPQRRPFRAGASRGRHRAFRPRFRLSPNCSSTAGAS